MVMSVEVTERLVQKPGDDESNLIGSLSWEVGRAVKLLALVLKHVVACQSTP